MSQKRRTYSTRERKQAEYNHEEHHRKRNKISHDDDELRLPQRVPRVQLQRSPTSLKRGFQQYSGPISIPPDDNDEINDHSTNPRENKVRSVFDKALRGKLKPRQTKQHNIYGSRQDFGEMMNERDRIKGNSNRPKNSYLPTPPSENQKQQHERLDYYLPSTTRKGAPLVPLTTTPPIEPTSKVHISRSNDERGHVFAQGQEDEEEEIDKSILPRRTIAGKRLSRRSTEARLWALNQADSPLLRLPKELRGLIYAYTFSGQRIGKGNTINISYQDFKTTWVGPRRIVTPVFKYCCTVFDELVNPFVEYHTTKATRCYTLLDGVCRQLYEETAVLPYRYSMIAFDSHLIMVNFLINERRLSRPQREAITQLMLPNDIPGANILSYLPNLEIVYLFTEQESYKWTPRGVYDVVRVDGKRPKMQHRNSGRFF